MDKRRPTEPYLHIVRQALELAFPAAGIFVGGGWGPMGVVQKARLRKQNVFQDRNKFLSQLKTEIEILSRRAANKNIEACDPVEWDQ